MRRISWCPAFAQTAQKCRAHCYSLSLGMIAFWTVIPAEASELASTGRASGLSAQTTMAIGTNLDQLHNGTISKSPEWANGDINNQNSFYAEGDAVPYRYFLSGLGSVGLTCPPDRQLPCGQSTDPSNTGTATATDNCGGGVTITFTDAATPTNCTGRTRVDRTWKATDACGNFATCVQLITFVDTTPPVVTCGVSSDTTVGECHNVVTWTPSATDNCAGPVAVTCTPPPGSTFPVGTTYLTCTATDPCGNVGTCQFTVTVVPNPTCSISGPTEIAQGDVASLCGPGDPGLSYLWNGPGVAEATTQCIQANQEGTYTLTVTDPYGCTSTCTHMLRIVSCACNVGYPDNSNPPRSQVIFNESEVLRALDPGPTACGPAGGSIELWYNDEHSLTLGVRRVIVKTTSGTTTTDYPITPTPAAPTCVDNPLVGSTIASGDQSGNDTAAGDGRPVWPALFITDLTVNGSSSRAGDWQQGGTGVPPHRVCGTWKAAVKTVDNTHVPAVVTVKPDGDPAKNNWNIDGGDTPRGGFGSLTNQGYGAECVWFVNQLGLTPGHTYRLYFMVHDGDQNKTGGDVGHDCTTVHAVSVPASIGVYFDPLFTRTSLREPLVNHPFKVWIALRGTPKVSSWEASFSIYNPNAAPLTVLSATLQPPGSVNHGSPDNWIVDLPGCVNTAPGDSLAVVEYVMQLHFWLPCYEIGFRLGAATPSRFSPASPGWFDCAGSGASFASVGSAFFGGCFSGENPPEFVRPPEGSPNHGSSPLTVQFSADVSDQDTPLDQLRYYWFFDDGGFATGQSPQHTYTQPGSYLVWVNVTDGFLDRTATVSIDVRHPIAVDPGDAPSALLLHAAYPVPFERSTRLAFDLPQAGHVTLRVHDVSGRIVTTVISEWRPAGRYSASWDGLDDSGRSLPPGVYTATLDAGAQRQSARLVLIK